MKKIFIIIAIFLSFFISWKAIADETSTKSENNDWNFTKIKISMDLSSLTWYNCSPVEDYHKKIHYECQIPKSTKWIFEMVWNIIKYFAFLASIIWVLAIVVAGILYTTEIVSKDDAKKIIIRILVWIIVLFSSGYILQLIAPWIYK